LKSNLNILFKFNQLIQIDYLIMFLLPASAKIIMSFYTMKLECQRFLILHIRV